MWIRAITKLPISEQSYKGKVKTHKYINRQNQSTTENCENRNDPDLVQAFLKKWWVESDFKAPNLPLSLRLKVSGCHYNSIYDNTWTKQVKQLSKQHKLSEVNYRILVPFKIHGRVITFDCAFYKRCHGQGGRNIILLHYIRLSTADVTVTVK